MIIAALLLSVSVRAAVHPAIPASVDSTAAGHRPKIGLVLSGGGAKGISHIGVLKLLEEMQIPVDYITGTSIGSIIGGLYALGYSADEMETLILNTDWNEMMKDAISRHERLYEFNERDDRMLLDIPVMNRDNIVSETALGKKAEGLKTKSTGVLSNIPLALVEGQNLNSLFTQLSVGYQDDIDFNDLPIPFACVAVDLTSRKPVIIREGNIVDAMRSSMSIPGYFAPIFKDGKMLVDGGMLNNLPVDVARQMGADIVIAVDLHKYDKSNFKDPDNLGGMVASVLKILNGEKYRKSVADADVCITPNTGSYGILDFTPKALKALSDSGYFAALEHIEQLEFLSNVEKGYWKEKRIARKHAIDLHKDSVRISKVIINGADPKEEEFIARECNEIVGEYATGQQIDALVRMLYSTRAFSKVTYSVCNVPGDSSYVLKMNFTPEKMHSVGFGMRFDTEEIASVLFNVSLNRHKLFGWRAELDAVLSYNPVIALSGSYAFNQKWQINATYRFRRSEVSPYEAGQKLVSYTYYCHSVVTDAEYKGKFSDLRLYHMFQNARVPALDNNIFADNLSLGARYGFDSYDNCYFPTRGLLIKGDAGYSYYCKMVNAESENAPYGRIYFDISGVVPILPKFVMIPGFMSRFVLAPDRVNFVTNVVGGYEAGRYVDGQMPFVGADYSYFVGDLAAIGRVDFRWNFVGKHYAVAIANVLAQAETVNKLNSIAFNWGVGLGYSYNSFLGPIGIRVHYSDLARKVGVYLYAGYSF